MSRKGPKQEIPVRVPTDGRTFRESFGALLASATGVAIRLSIRKQTMSDNTIGPDEIASRRYVRVCMGSCVRPNRKHRTPNALNGNCGWRPSRGARPKDGYD